MSSPPPAENPPAPLTAVPSKRSNKKRKQSGGGGGGGGAGGGGASGRNSIGGGEGGGKSERTAGSSFFPLPSGNEESGVELSEAEAYLLRVREEERTLPRVVTVSNPYRLPSEASTNPGRIRKTREGFYVATSTAPSDSAVAGVSIGPVLPQARDPRLPSQRWQAAFAKHFQALRTNLKHPSTQPHPTTPGFASSAHPPAHYLPIPRDRDFVGWREYIQGAKRKRVKKAAAAPTMVVLTVPVTAEDLEDEEAALNDDAAALDEEEAMNDNEAPPPVKIEYEEDENGDWSAHVVEPEMEDAGVGSEEESDEEDEEEGELEPLEDRHLPKEPSLTLIQRFSEPTILQLLKHLTRLLQAPPLPPTFLSTQPTSDPAPALVPPAPPRVSFPPLLARWTLSLLAKLDAQLSSDGVSTLRTLARAALEVLADGKDAVEEEERAGCWMVWEAVVEGWAQRDLREEEKAVLVP